MKFLQILRSVLLVLSIKCIEISLTEKGNSENVLCVPSITTASGTTFKELSQICSGDLIFEDNFKTLDFEKWQHENTLAGGGNWEFQWYTNNRSNSFIQNDILHIRPTLTEDVLGGEQFLKSGTLSIHGGSPADECTNPSYWGCERTGTIKNLINPIVSARLRTFYSFSFKYGKLETRAKLSAGDWLWPAIWLLPKHNAYGGWPASGEIDIVESRGNKILIKDGINIGGEQIASTLHFGPYPALNAYKKTHFLKNSAPGEAYNENFHRYQMEWTPEFIKFSVDDNEIGLVTINQTNLWNIGEFDKKQMKLDNPWKTGSSIAPFDKEFYIIISLAVGGITFFPDDAKNPTDKPWLNTSPTASYDFWTNRNLWLPTWNLLDKNNSDASLLVDYIKVYAL